MPFLRLPQSDWFRENRREKWWENWVKISKDVTLDALNRNKISVLTISKISCISSYNFFLKYE